MSQDRDQEIIGRLRRGFEAFNRGDFDAATEGYHPDIEVTRRGGQSPVRGRAAVRAWFEPDAIAEQHFEPLAIRVHSNKALVRLRNLTKGARSGIELDFVMWLVFSFDEDGEATRIESFLPHQEAAALEAAGLDAPESVQ